MSSVFLPLTCMNAFIVSQGRHPGRREQNSQSFPTRGIFGILFVLECWTNKSVLDSLVPSMVMGHRCLGLSARKGKCWAAGIFDFRCPLFWVLAKSAWQVLFRVNGLVCSEEFGWFGGILEEFVREKHCSGWKKKRIKPGLRTRERASVIGPLPNSILIALLPSFSFSCRTRVDGYLGLNLLFLLSKEWF